VGYALVGRGGVTFTRWSSQSDVTRADCPAFGMSPPNPSLERTGDAGAEARDNGDAGSWKAL